MTVIVWDGKTLAADKRASSGSLRFTVCKIERSGDRTLLGTTGSSATSQELLHWWKNGADPAKFPAAARNDESYGTLVVITPGRIAQYTMGPYPTVIVQAQMAFGSGRDFALAALHMGADARKAVEVACHFATDCGDGIDTLTLE